VALLGGVGGHVVPERGLVDEHGAAAAELDELVRGAAVAAVAQAPARGVVEADALGANYGRVI
jgi:hypothetical protein